MMWYNGYNEDKETTNKEITGDDYKLKILQVKIMDNGEDHSAG